MAKSKKSSKAGKLNRKSKQKVLRSGVAYAQEIQEKLSLRDRYGTTLGRIVGDVWLDDVIVELSLDALMKQEPMDDMWRVSEETLTKWLAQIQAAKQERLFNQLVEVSDVD